MIAKEFLFILLAFCVSILFSNCEQNPKQLYKYSVRTTDSNKIEANTIISSILLRLSQVNKSNYIQLLTKLNSAIDLDSTSYTAYYYKSKIYFKIGDTSGALDNIDKAISLKGNEYLFLKVKGIIFDSNNFRDSADFYYRKALSTLEIELKTDPSDQMLNLDRLLILCLLGKKEYAISELSKIKQTQFYNVQPNKEIYNQVIRFNRTEYLQNYIIDD